MDLARAIDEYLIATSAAALELTEVVAAFEIRGRITKMKFDIYDVGEYNYTSLLDSSDVVENT